VSDHLNADQKARIEAENALRRTAYLYDATSTLFEAPLDVSQRLVRVAQLLVPDMGDWCWIDTFDAGEVRRAVTHHWNSGLLAEVAVVPPRRIEGCSSGLARVMETARPELVVNHSEHDLADAPRTEFHSIVRAPLHDSNELIGVISTGFAESNRVHTPADLALVDALATRAGWAIQAARQYDLAKKAIAAREDILAIVAHDLRGPLGTVSLASDMMRTPDTAPVVDTIDRAVQRMERLIADLLDWASIESGHLRVSIAPTELAAMLGEAAEGLGPQAAARQIELVASAPDHDVSLSCDRARTLQVIGNLVGNAIKFTPKGGRIRLGADIEASFVRISVEDQGPGIAAEHLPHIFERYWQADPGTEHRHGVGLGLAIASGIVAAQGGQISVASVPGEGTRFTFTIPRT